MRSPARGEAAARLAALSRHYRDDHPRMIAARRHLQMEQAEDLIREVIAMPELDVWDLDVLAGKLLGAR